MASSFSSTRTKERRGEPIHIHVEKAGIEAKFWLLPEVRVAYNDGYDARTLRELMAGVEENKSLILKAWNEYFG